MAKTLPFLTVLRMHLDVSFNRLQGEIPASLFNCTRLRYLNVKSNQIGGEQTRDESPNCATCL